MTAQAQPHGAITRLFHWITVGLIIYAYIRNGDVTGALDSPEAMRTEVLFGAGVGVFLAIRFLWVGRQGRTRLPTAAPRWEHTASRLVHRGIYLGLGLIILSGFGIAYVSAWGDPWLEIVSDIHIVLTDLTLILMVGHVVAAIWHKLYRKDGVMESMTGTLSR